METTALRAPYQVLPQKEGQKLPLTNEGALDLFFVGTGSAFARTLNQNNLIVVKGDTHLLVDCGAKCPQSLFQYGLAIPDFHHYLITHSHADHIGGLEEAMMFGRYLTKKKPAMIICPAYEKILWNESLRGGAAHSEVKKGKLLGFKDFWEPLRPTKLKGAPRETWQYRLGELEILMPRTKHVPDNARTWRDSFWSVGVILDRRVFFTSDTRFDRELLEDFDRLYHFEVIMHDCQLFNGGVHASFEELCTLPEDLRRRILLMHVGDSWRNYLDKARAAGFLGIAEQGSIYRFA